MNICHRITSLSKTNSLDIATVMPKKRLFSSQYDYKTINFFQLERLIHQFASGLKSKGFKKGDKTLLFLKPCIEFHALVFALFKIGVVPVLIDPGMGRKKLFDCIKEIKPTGLIGENIVHLLRKFFPKTFQEVSIYIGPKDLFDFQKIVQLEKTEDLEPNDLAAILFTSGGTGRPKGVEYTHKIFDTQTQELQKMFNLSGADKDMAGFPLFSLFTLAMGMSSCIPDLNPAKPGKCNPKKIVQNILDFSPTFVCGSPAIWIRVVDFCLKENITLDSVKYVVMFGAPVSIEIHEKFQKILSQGTTYTPYGATESLPIANISGKEILETKKDLINNGAGICVGKPVSSIEVKIIKNNDEIISTFKKDLELEKGSVGEIIVKGDVVTRRYHNNSRSNLESKINDGTTFWHRMGDLGYIDNEGNLWFCGRKAHMVETKEAHYYSAKSEAIFNQHPNIKRSAIIKTENGVGVVLNSKKAPSKKIIKEVRSLAEKHDETKLINHFYYAKKFPVDVRHNIKIDRKKLSLNAMKGKLRRLS